MAVTTDRWRKMAATLREDAEGADVERNDLLSAAQHIEDAANSFDAAQDAEMRRLYVNARTA